MKSVKRPVAACFLHTFLLENEAQTSGNKIQGSDFQLNRSPHAKIQLIWTNKKKQTKIRHRMVMPWRLQLFLNRWPSPSNKCNFFFWMDDPSNSEKIQCNHRNSYYMEFHLKMESLSYVFSWKVTYVKQQDTDSKLQLTKPFSPLSLSLQLCSILLKKLHNLVIFGIL